MPPLTWEAVATFATGFVAVAGAVFVGKRQTSISRRQNEILDRQTRIAEANLRADLFERRLQTFESTADFISHISELPELDPKHEERLKLFSAKLRESRFLFRPGVYESLYEIWDKGNEARSLRSSSIDNHKHGIRNDPDVERRLLEIPTWIFQTHDKLADLFRDDLSLGQLLDVPLLPKPSE